MLRLVLCILLGCSTTLRADPSSPEDLFRNGLTAYQNKNYEEARDAFQKALAQGPRSPQVLHNLALTYYQLNQKPQAMAFWRRALTMSPTYKAARAGRDLLESRLNMRPFERDSVSVWMARTLSSLSIFELLWLTALASSLTGWLWIRYLADRKNALDEEQPLPTFPTPAVLLSLALVACLALIDLKLGESGKTRATVITEKASAHSLPTDEAVSLFEVLGGHEVLVRQQQNGWSQVQNGDGSTGWMKDSDILITSER